MGGRNMYMNNDMSSQMVNMMSQDMYSNMMNGNMMGQDMMNHNMMGQDMTINMISRDMMNNQMMGQDMLQTNMMNQGMNRMNSYANNELMGQNRNMMSQRMEIEQIPSTRLF